MIHTDCLQSVFFSSCFLIRKKSLQYSKAQRNIILKNINKKQASLGERRTHNKFHTAKKNPQGPISTS